MQMKTLQSYVAGRWVGTEAAQVLRSAINGQAVAATHADRLDFAEAVQHARKVGVPHLMKLDFQQRAERLKALAKFLVERKEALYAISAHTGRVATAGSTSKAAAAPCSRMPPWATTNCLRATWCTRAP